MKKKKYIYVMAWLPSHFLSPHNQKQKMNDIYTYKYETESWYENKFIFNEENQKIILRIFSRKLSLHVSLYIIYIFFLAHIQ